MSAQRAARQRPKRGHLARACIRHGRPRRPRWSWACATATAATTTAATSAATTTAPPPPPPLPEFINLVLAVPIANEGHMSEAEVLAVLNVTQRRPKWLLSHVHPDKHPDFEAEARCTMATARVNQAMDVRSTRHM